MTIANLQPPHYHNRLSCRCRPPHHKDTAPCCTSTNKGSKVCRPDNYQLWVIQIAGNHTSNTMRSHLPTHAHLDRITHIKLTLHSQTSPCLPDGTNIALQASKQAKQTNDANDVWVGCATLSGIPEPAVSYHNKGATSNQGWDLTQHLTDEKEAQAIRVGLNPTPKR